MKGQHYRLGQWVLMSLTGLVTQANTQGTDSQGPLGRAGTTGHKYPVPPHWGLGVAHLSPSVASLGTGFWCLLTPILGPGNLTWWEHREVPPFLSHTC